MGDLASDGNLDKLRNTIAPTIWDILRNEGMTADKFEETADAIIAGTKINDEIENQKIKELMLKESVIYLKEKKIELENLHYTFQLSSHPLFAGKASGALGFDTRPTISHIDKTINLLNLKIESVHNKINTWSEMRQKDNTEKEKVISADEVKGLVLWRNYLEENFCLSKLPGTSLEAKRLGLQTAVAFWNSQMIPEKLIGENRQTEACKINELSEVAMLYFSSELHSIDAIIAAKKSNDEKKGENKKMTDSPLEQQELTSAQNPIASDLLIRWTGKDTQLIYLLEQLRKNGFLQQSQDTAQIIENHFCDENGNPFKNIPQTWRNVQNNKGGKCRKADVLDKMISDAKNKK